MAVNERLPVFISLTIQKRGRDRDHHQIQAGAIREQPGLNQDSFAVGAEGRMREYR